MTNGEITSFITIEDDYDIHIERKIDDWMSSIKDDIMDGEHSGEAMAPGEYKSVLGGTVYDIMNESIELLINNLNYIMNAFEEGNQEQICIELCDDNYRLTKNDSEYILDVIKIVNPDFYTILDKALSDYKLLKEI